MCLWVCAVFCMLKFDRYFIDDISCMASSNSCSVNYLPSMQYYYFTNRLERPTILSFFLTLACKRSNRAKWNIVGEWVEETLPIVATFVIPTIQTNKHPIKNIYVCWTTQHFMCLSYTNKISALFLLLHIITQLMWCLLLM